MDSVHELTQDYSKYTDEDFQVWAALFKRQMELFPKVAAKAYLEGIEIAGFREDKIPDLKDVIERLGNYTGWKLQVVPGIVANEKFFPMIAAKKFPATTWLRKMSQLDYISEPDMFHDVLGHVPLLSNPHFSDFFVTLGRLGEKHIDNSWVIELLGRLYWFTVEFGLIDDGSGLRIYGAGILSSHGETKFSLSEVPKRVPFSANGIMDTPYENNHIQDTYFVINSFEQLFHSIPEIEARVEREAAAHLKHKQDDFSKIYKGEEKRHDTSSQPVKEE